MLVLYERPYNPREPVVCLDEKPVPLHAEVRPPPAGGHVTKRDNEYRRCGMANVFAVVEPIAGRQFTFATANRSAREFARMVRRVVGAYPGARTIHIVMDNLNTHAEKSLTDHLGVGLAARCGGASRCISHRSTVSWVNPAELELSLWSHGCLGRRRIAALRSLQLARRAWTTRANRAKLGIRWQFTRRDARRKFGYQENLSTRSKT